MGLIKPNNYSKEELRIHRKLGACSNPARLRMINIMRIAPTALEQFCLEVNLSKSSVAEHIQILKRAGLIETNYICHVLYYSVNEGSLSEIHKVFHTIQSKIKKPSHEIERRP